MSENIDKDILDALSDKDIEISLLQAEIFLLKTTYVPNLNDLQAENRRLRDAINAAHTKLFVLIIPYRKFINIESDTIKNIAVDLMDQSNIALNPQGEGKP